MGCDIHCYMEYRPKNQPGERWQPFGGRINPGRDYRMFGNLAGVRGGIAIIEPRGYPDDASWYADGDYWCYISDSKEESSYVTPAKAAEYVSRLGCRYKDLNGKHAWVSHPDWHSHSWLTTDEWERVIQENDKSSDYPCWIEYKAMLAAMRSLESFGNDCRVVFWFDN